MGDEMSARTRQALLDGLRAKLLPQAGPGSCGREVRPQVLDGDQLSKMVSVLTLSRSQIPCGVTSLLFVSTAGRGAAPSGAAPAYLRGNQ